MPNRGNREAGLTDGSPDLSTFMGRLQSLVDSHGGASSYARLAGMSESMMRKYLAGAEPGRPALLALARAGVVTAQWLADGTGPKQDLPKQFEEAREIGPVPRRPNVAEPSATYGAPQLVDRGFRLVPRYDVRAAAGHGELAGNENVLDYMAFQEAWLRSLGIDPRRLALISAVGDSMEPTIRAGDLLLIDTGITRIRDDSIYVIVRNGELAVKRLQTFFRGAVAVRSDNPAYTEETLSQADVEQLRVAGRVIWIARMI